MSSEASPARALMDRFAAATGVDSAGGPSGVSRRYLWTDAFAVCNWLGLGEVDRARRLVDQVHQVLGRHRDDDPRQGWISGLPAEEGASRPTAGGLRIGKPLPERRTDEPYDPQLEWERDGQYYHYLTRWMRALQRVSAATGEARYHEWAVELAVVGFDRFAHGIGPVPNRLYWKMSIDLSRPQVPSMGQHDPLDGYVAMSELHARGAGPGPGDSSGPAAGSRAEATSGSGAASGSGGALTDRLGLLAGMGEESDWPTDDPLGAGSLLTDAWLLARLPAPYPERSRILERVIRAAAISLRDVRDVRILELPAARRLAFRELGLAIGLAAAERLVDAAGSAARFGPELSPQLRELRDAVPMGAAITGFWLDPANRDAPAWREHEDINTVMLATALDPTGYLDTARQNAG